MIGKDSTTRNWTTSTIHTKTGMRISVIPGARMLKMVVMKLTPAIIEAAPRICRPSSQKSMLGPGEYSRRVSGV